MKLYRSAPGNSGVEMVAPFTESSHPGLTRSAASAEFAARAAKNTVAFTAYSRLLRVRNANVIHLSLAADYAAVGPEFYESVKPDATPCTFYAFNKVTGAVRANFDSGIPTDAVFHFRKALQALADMFTVYG